MWRLAGMVTIVCAATGVAACGSDSSSSSAGGGGDCKLVIGAVGPLSGPAANFGKSMTDVADFTAKTANDAGGLKVGDKKCQVSVEKVDTKYSSAGAAAAANQFAAKGVKFVIGPVASLELEGMKPIAGRRKMLLLTSGYGPHDLDPKYPLTFHLSPGPFVFAKQIITKAKAKYGFSSVTSIGPNDLSGTATIDTDDKYYGELGVKTHRELYERGITDFTALVQRIRRANSDLVDFAGTPAGDAGVIAKQLRQSGYKGPFGRLGGESTAQIAAAAGGLDVLGDFFFSSPSDPANPGIKKLADEYKAVVGHDVPPATLAFTPPARALMKAITDAGTIDDTEKVAEALRKQPLDDPDFGKGVWTGQDQFGINQEFTFPFYMGVLEAGKLQPYTQVLP
jgi:branched-chain amino acid transport system substrate-binding protein